MSGRGGRFFWLGLMVMAIATITTTASAATVRPVVERRLANGLRVLVCADPAGVDASILVHYDVGSRDEPGGLEGIAHLIEHLMFTGSKHVAPGSFESLLERAGATNLNAETSVDATHFHETVPPERLALALWLESDRMGYLLDHLDERALAQERAAVLNEYRLRVTERTLGNLENIVRAELFPPWHPYSHLPVGVPKAIASITLADARAFVNTWYGPGNATLVISGNVDPNAAIALAERYFSALPARPPPQRPALPPLPIVPERVIHVGANVTRFEVRVEWLTPRLRTPGDLELDVVSDILVGDESGWLQRRLVDAPRIAASVSAGQRSMDLASIFEIRALVSEGHTAEEVLAVIDDALGRFDAGVSAAEVQRAQLAWFSTKLFGLESSLAWASRLDFAVHAAPAPTLFDAQLQKYAAIRPDAVRAAKRTFLDRAHRLVTLIEPVKSLPSHGALVRREEVSR